MWYNVTFIDMRNFKFFLGYFNLENLFYWIIGNVGIVEIIEKFWKLWHSFASWLCEEMINILKSV